MGDRAVAPDEAIGATPAIGSASHGFVDGFAYVRPVFRMDIVQPEIGTAGGGIDVVAEAMRHGLVPPDPVGADVQVPDHVMGDAGDQAEAFLAGLQRGLYPFAFRDVLEMYGQSACRRIGANVEPAQVGVEFLESHAGLRVDRLPVPELEHAAQGLREFLPEIAPQ
ncbi:hypothetical protein D3C86_1278500 [compost metagenome]